MNKINKYIFLLTAIFVVMFGFSFSARAMTPVISLTVNNDNDSAQLNVNGDASTSVLLYYSKTGVGPQIVSLGNTNSSGYFSTSVSTSYYQIISNSLIYVITGGINGNHSNTLNWPNIQGSSSANFTLSQSALLLNIGQTSTITASSSYMYLLSNSVPAIANVNINTNSNQITINANAYGTTIANICVLGSTANCANITITVQNSGTQQLTFSQNNFSIVSGQSVSVSITNNSAPYTITNNSNSGSIQSSLSGSVITLTANNTTGTASITVCTTNMSSCGIINVSATTVNSSTVTFSQTNPVVAIGQSVTVTIYGNSGTNFYVATNSNPSIVQANINGNILTLIGNTTGTSTISVCAYAGSCASLTANVGSYSNTGGAMSLSQSSVSILAGQSTSVTILGGSSPYNFSSVNSSNIFNGNIIGNILTIYGVNTGSGTANVCSSAGCVALFVTINSSNSSGSGSQPTFSQNYVSLNVGQQAMVSISGAGGYYVSNNSNYNIASVQISASTATIVAIGVGSTNISICQLQNQCAIIYVTVNSQVNQSSNLVITPSTQTIYVGSLVSFTATAYGLTNPTYTITDSFSNTSVLSSNINSSGVFSWVPQLRDLGSHNLIISATDSYGHSASGTAYFTVTQSSLIIPQTISYTFTRYLGYGDKGEDVRELQKILVKQGFLIATPSGNYGSATREAVKKFQAQHGIKSNGLVGPETKNALNQTSSSGDSSKQQQILLLLQQIQQLQAQLNLMRISGQQ